MSDKPTWQVARLDEIERRGRDIPVREHLGSTHSESTPTRPARMAR